MQFQFNDMQRTITKLDKSITSIRFRGTANSELRVKVGKNNIKYKKGKNSRKKGSGIKAVRTWRFNIELLFFWELTFYSKSYSLSEEGLFH